MEHIEETPQNDWYEPCEDRYRKSIIRMHEQRQELPLDKFLNPNLSEERRNIILETNKTLLCKPNIPTDEAIAEELQEIEGIRKCGRPQLYLIKLLVYTDYIFDYASPELIREIFEYLCTNTDAFEYTQIPKLYEIINLLETFMVDPKTPANRLYYLKEFEYITATTDIQMNIFTTPEEIEVIKGLVNMLDSKLNFIEIINKWP